MKPDDEPTDDERREAEALATALEPGEEGGQVDRASDTQVTRPVAATPDGLDIAVMLRHARPLSSLSADAQAIAAAHATPHLDARRARHRRRGRVWLATSLGVPAAAVAVLLVFFGLPALHTAPGDRRGAFMPLPPPPPPELLAAQAQAARGGGQAIAALDLRMRAYRRTFHDGLRNRRGDTP